MQRSVLELAFRHKMLMVLPAVLCVLFASVLTLLAPREYVAAGSAWAVAPPAGEDRTPPSTREQILLNQALSTRAFLRQVAADTPLSDDLAGATPDELDLILDEIRDSITSTVNGPDVLAIEVVGKDPQTAIAVAASVVEQFNQSMQERASASATQNLASAKVQFDEAARALAAARKRVSPGVATIIEADPTAPLPAGASAETVALHTAQTRYQAAGAAYAQAQVLSSAPSMDKLTVIDEADRATAQPRMKALMFAVVGGGMVGLTLSAAALLVLLATDRRVRVPADLPAELGLTVLAEVPEAEVLGARRAAVPRPANDVSELAP